MQSIVVDPFEPLREEASPVVALGVQENHVDFEEEEIMEVRSFLFGFQALTTL